MYVRIFVTCMDVRRHVCMYAWERIHVHVCVHRYIHVHIFGCVAAARSLCEGVGAHRYICLRACLYVYIYIYVRM